MSVTVQDVKDALPKYAKLDDTQIAKALEIAEGSLAGVNADWRTHAEADSALLLSAISTTLKLHFPQQVDAFHALDNQVIDILNSVWSSSNMVKNKNSFMRIVGEREDEQEDYKYVIAKRR